MTHDPITPPHVQAQPAPMPASQPAPTRSTAVIVLSILVIVEAVIILALGGIAAYLWGQQTYFQDEMFYPSAEEEEIWMMSDMMAMDVGYYVQENDLQGYLDLYDPADTHVDFDTVEAEFTQIAQRAQEEDAYVEFMSDMMPMVYEDDDTGETIVRMTVSGMDYNTGRTVGGRLTVYVLYDDGDMSLTGNVGRDLTATGSVW